MRKTFLRIWIIAEAVPSFKGGAPIRNYQLATGLAALGHAVSIFCIASEEDKSAIDALLSHERIKIHTAPPFTMRTWHTFAALIHRVIPYMYRFQQSGVKEMVVDRLKTETPDIIQFEQTNAYFMMLPVMGRLRESGAKLVLDAHNVEQILLEKTIPVFSWPKCLVGRYILPNYRRIENAAALTVDLVTACSPDDANFFRALGAKRVAVIPNGVDAEFYHSLPETEENSILFMGGTNYPPNEDAMRWYFDQIYPLVKQKNSGVKMYVIGSKPQSWLAKTAEEDPSIMLLGFVPDERMYLAKAKVCISPMRLGSGTGLKILTYMASARAVVSTRIGVRGIDHKDKYTVLTADSARDFAECITAVLHSSNLARSLGANARGSVVSMYAWPTIVNTLDSRYQSIQEIKQ